MLCVYKCHTQCRKMMRVGPKGKKIDCIYPSKRDKLMDEWIMSIDIKMER